MIVSDKYGLVKFSTNNKTKIYQLHVNHIFILTVKLFDPLFDHKNNNKNDVIAK